MTEIENTQAGSSPHDEFEEIAFVAGAPYASFAIHTAEEAGEEEGGGTSCLRTTSLKGFAWSERGEGRDRTI